MLKISHDRYFTAFLETYSRAMLLIMSSFSWCPVGTSQNKICGLCPFLWLSVFMTPCVPQTLVFLMSSAKYFFSFFLIMGTLMQLFSVDIFQVIRSSRLLHISTTDSNKLSSLAGFESGVFTRYAGLYCY